MTSMANHSSTRRRVAGMVCDQWRWGKKPGGTPSAAPVLTGTQQHQKAVRHTDEQGMAMKAVPQPPFILIPAQLPFGLLVELLDGMPLVRNTDQELQAHLGTRIAEIVLPLPLLPPGGALPNQPPIDASAFRTGPPAAPADKLLAQAPTAPLAPVDRLPGTLGQAAEHGVGPLHAGIRSAGQLDAEITGHRDHVELVPTLQPRQ